MKVGTFWGKFQILKSETFFSGININFVNLYLISDTMCAS